MKKNSVSLISMLTLTVMGTVQNVYADSKKPAEPPAHVYMKEKPAETIPQDESVLSGKVVETMNSGGYTYICIDKDGKKTWAAVLETKVTVGQDVVIQPGYEMVNFASKTLNRTFDKIIFSTGLVLQDATAETKSFHGKSMVSKGAGTPSDEKIKVEKASAPNAYTVAECYVKKAELDKKSIIVKGKVVKVSSGIMGKNWLHIQDGTGTAEGGNNDLVVTTSEIAAVGDIVTATGILYKDKDFGSGYKYDVIVEEASIKQ